MFLDSQSVLNVELEDRIKALANSEDDRMPVSVKRIVIPKRTFDDEGSCESSGIPVNINCAARLLMLNVYCSMCFVLMSTIYESSLILECISVM
jgi:hypothetical protein